MTTKCGPQPLMPEPSFGAGLSPAATLDEERREVFAGVLESLRIQEPDADQAAACSYLLRHLARTEPPFHSTRYD